MSRRGVLQMRQSSGNDVFRKAAEKDRTLAGIETGRKLVSQVCGKVHLHLKQHSTTELSSSVGAAPQVEDLDLSGEGEGHVLRWTTSLEDESAATTQSCR
jgi:hypothetical protein